MTRIPFSMIVIVTVVLGSIGLAARDKYTVQVPNGLAFSEFRGYEDWQVVAVSQTEELLKVMVANPTMTPTGPAFRATASFSPTAPRLRRSSGNRKRVRRPPFQ
jgi:hypothetical protein